MKSPEHYSDLFSDELVRAWIDQDAIMVKIVEPKFGDPVELNTDEARKVANILLAYADLIDGQDK